MLFIVRIPQRVMDSIPILHFVETGCRLRMRHPATHRSTHQFLVAKTEINSWYTQSSRLQSKDENQSPAAQSTWQCENWEEEKNEIAAPKRTCGGTQPSLQWWRYFISFYYLFTNFIYSLPVLFSNGIYIYCCVAINLSSPLVYWNIK